MEQTIHSNKSLLQEIPLGDYQVKYDNS